jgi:hypothetical protein
MVPFKLPPVDAEPDSIQGMNQEESIATESIEHRAPSELDYPTATLEETKVGSDSRAGQIAWNKIAPLLVLPILRGENLSYGQRGEWEEKARETASQLGLELPWDEVIDGDEEGDLLRRLEPLPPFPLLFLGAALLLRQEALYAGHWAGETPLLDFVLGLQSAHQSELEVDEEVMGEEAMDEEVSEGESDLETGTPEEEFVLSQTDDSTDDPQNPDEDTTENEEDPNLENEVI